MGNKFNGRPMQTKGEYLALVRTRPWGFSTSMSLGLPAEWVREAWDLPEVQGEVIPGGILRDVSKTGSLCQRGDYLSWLSETLSAAQVVRLYLDIRAACATREEEFRPEFLAAFAQHADAIPPPLSRGEVAEILGLTAEEAEAYWREVDTPRTLQLGPGIESDEDIPF
ncbi:hypothetical protein [Gemmata sp.]|uniref:hypothetical protein n=1 Tax=Gemmata sp. TaxID=1914242 RepID=UPI003F722DD6